MRLCPHQPSCPHRSSLHTHGFMPCPQWYLCHGLDAAAKLCILARSGMRYNLKAGDVSRESIRVAGKSRLASATARGMWLRTVATLNRDNHDCIQGGITLTDVPLESPLARTGSENAVVFHSRFSGTLSMISKGAGPIETAPAVIRDLAMLSESWCT